MKNLNTIKKAVELVTPAIMLALFFIVMTFVVGCNGPTETEPMPEGTIACDTNMYRPTVDSECIYVPEAPTLPECENSDEYWYDAEDGNYVCINEYISEYVLCREGMYADKSTGSCKSLPECENGDEYFYDAEDGTYVCINEYI